MARIEFDGFDGIDGQLQKLERMDVKRIVMAGAEAAVGVLQTETESHRHVLTGAMMTGVAPGQYHESLGGGYVDVYPQGSDPKGISNAKKAFIINYGRGGKKTAKTGDKFITGGATKSKLETAVGEAMKAEAGRLFREAGG